MPRTCHRDSKRQGVTLLESLLALALFAAGMLASGHLMQRGSDSALRAELEAYACVHCESAINSVSIGTLAPGASMRLGNTVVETTVFDSQWPGLSIIEAKARFDAEPDRDVFVLSKLVRLSHGRSLPAVRSQANRAGGVQ